MQLFGRDFSALRGVQLFGPGAPYQVWCNYLGGLHSKHLNMNRELTAWRLSNRLSAMIKRQRKLPDTVKNIRYMDSLFRRYYLCLSIINQLPHQKCNYDYKNISIQKPHGTN